MLERLNRIAINLQGLKPYLLILAVLSLVAGVYVLLSSANQSDDRYLIPAFILFTWAVMARSFITLFFHVPSKATTTAGWWERCKIACTRGIYYGFLALFAISSAFLILGSWQLGSVWRMMY